MIYLILAIVSSMLVSVIMRVSEKYSRNNLSMLAMNYLMCSILGMMQTGRMELFPAHGGLPLTLGLGVISGMLYLGGFALYQWNIRRNGVVLPATFMKLGVIVPTLMAMLVFGEHPRMIQIAGIVAAIAAILLMQGKGEQRDRSIGALVLLMLAGGGADGMSKIFEELGPAELKGHFMMYTFAVALILCVILCLVKGQKLALPDALFGLAIGVPNYFSSWFLLLSLEYVPATVAFPSFSVGTIIAVALVSAICFRERLGRRKLLALGVILAALAMLNL